MSTTGSSRRALLKAGGAVAWTTPVILAASAAPAVAGSGGAVAFDPGGSYVADDEYLEFRFVGFTITPSAAVAPGSLTLTATFSAGQLFKLDAFPPGWATSLTTGRMSSAVYTRSAAVAAGATVGFPDGAYFDANAQPGTFTLLMSAPGQTSATFQASTPAGAMRRPSRPLPSSRRTR